MCIRDSLYGTAERLVDRRKFKRNFLGYVRMKYPNFDAEMYNEYLHRKVYSENENHCVVDLKFSNFDAKNSKNDGKAEVEVEYKKVDLSQITVVEYVWKSGADEVKSYIDELCKNGGGIQKIDEVIEGSNVLVDVYNKKGDKVLAKDKNLEINEKYKKFIGKKVEDKVVCEFEKEVFADFESGAYICKVKKISKVKSLTVEELAKSLNVKKEELNSKVYTMILKEFSIFSKMAQRIEFFNFIEARLIDVLKDKVTDDLLERQKLEIKYHMKNNKENSSIDIDRYALRRAVVYVFLQYYSNQYGVEMKEVEDKVLLNKAIKKDTAKISFSELKKKIESVNV